MCHRILHLLSKAICSKAVLSTNQPENNTTQTDLERDHGFSLDSPRELLGFLGIRDKQVTCA